MKKILCILLLLCTGIFVCACSQPQAEPDNDPVQQSANEPEKDSQVLVAYFSATGTTKGVAEKIVQGLNADLFEIVPEQPYTDEDLDYGNDESRTTIEMNDDSVRAAIADPIENIDQYDTIYLGYPIWWGQAPKIMDTFVESYDLNGKTIIPFCTSGSSGIGSSAADLENLSNGALWKEGKRFSGSEPQEEIMEWVGTISLQ